MKSGGYCNLNRIHDINNMASNNVMIYIDISDVITKHETNISEGRLIYL